MEIAIGLQTERIAPQIHLVARLLSDVPFFIQLQFKNSEFLEIMEGNCCIECENFINCSEGKLEKECQEI